jgi:UDP-N-acetyl-2-amino-2-deoxyglucuronate dehydrogenase
MTNPTGALSKKIGIGILGLGNAAKPHARALIDLAPTHARVTGVFARDAARRKAFADAHGFPEAQSVEALIADPATNAILLLTPPNARTDIVDLCVRHRKAILMEKPVGRTTAEAVAMVEAAEAAKVPLGIVFQHRMRLGVASLRQLLASGRLGKIGLIRLVVPWWRGQAYYDEPGRGTMWRDGGGVLMSQAIHPLDMMLSVFGRVESVQAMAGTTSLHRMETEDFAAGGMRFENGAFGALIATTAAFPGGSETLAIDAENASLDLGNGQLVVRWRDGTTETFDDPLASGTGADPMAFDHGMHRAVLRDFLEAVAAGRDSSITGRSSLEVHYLMDAILKSSAEGRAIAVARGA